MTLPTWEDANSAMNSDATKLQELIYKNEPAGHSDESFRSDLAAALREYGMFLLDWINDKASAENRKTRQPHCYDLSNEFASAYARLADMEGEEL